MKRNNFCSSVLFLWIRNILNEILLSNLLLPSRLNRREQSFLKLCQMRLRSESIPKTLFPKMYAKETMIFFFDHMPLSFIILLIRIMLLVLIRLIIKAEFPAWWMVFKSLLFESLFRSDSGMWIPLYYISQVSVKARKRLVLENLSANPYNLPTLFSGLQNYARN